MLKFSLVNVWLGRLLSVTLASLFTVAWGDTFTVTTTANSGVGSLQWAITNANATVGLDRIEFQISGTPPFTITPTSALPTITGAVSIDATTQPGYVGKPVIELSGATAGVGAVGLKLAASASFSSVRGLVINRFTASGIELNGSSNTIVGNYIGTDVTGTQARGNGALNSAYGIWITTFGNLIGGTNIADGNVISGNNDAGIFISGAGGNVVQGNWIGVSAANSATALGNANHGIVIYNSAGNIIGGSIASAGNVISGNANGASGIALDLAGASGNWIQGNRIGMDASGSLVVGNTGDGITILNAPGNRIGPGNVISGNHLAGVSLQATAPSYTAYNNLVIGNWIGTDVTGTLARPNAAAGVSILAANSNQIGGTNNGDGNVISGNGVNGIQLATLNGITTKGTVIQGNLIGVNAGGTSALRNGYQGIFLSGASSNLIGGLVAGARNIISGNASNGVFIASLTDTNNVLQGNFIGTDVTGSLSIANGLDGVHLQACFNLIGGTNSGCQNVISGNAVNGVFLVGTGGNVTGNMIQGNCIGLDATGNNALPNGDSGVGIWDAAANQIGGTAAGAGNMISANSYEGIFVYAAGSTSNLIQGNLIGTDAGGTQARGNSSIGIDLETGSSNVIGGSTPGAGNVVAASGSRGIYLLNATRNVIQGNWVGTDISGTNNLGNTFHALECDTGSSGNIIGGTNALAGNRFAYSKPLNSGVRVRDGTINNLISGNSIFGNSGGLGINLGVNAGVNPNLDCEGGASSSKANFAQNYPVITNVISGANTRIRGYLNSGINKTYRLQFFASAAGNPSGFGEGQIFLGEQNLVLGANCTSNFSVTLPAAMPPGWIVTATATDPANNTSEFSALVLVTNLPPLNISVAGSGQQSIFWTNRSGPYTLQQTYSLNPPITWFTVTNLPIVSNGNYSVTVTTTNLNTFYRLLAP